jgi:hypothetical protein
MAIHRRRKLVPHMTFEPHEGPRKKLLVGSVFGGDEEIQQRWLDLQLRFLEETTDSYDHVVVLYGDATNDYFESRTDVIRCDKGLVMSEAHMYGLRILQQYFRSRETAYDHFLFIDSDAFPIKPDWVSQLVSQMKDAQIATVLRSENLERRLHASVLFTKPEALRFLAFDRKMEIDLVGSNEHDICIEYFKERLEQVFTLVRSNQFNIHPVVCGVYYDMFYHHCFGSGREFNLRSKDYWNFIETPDMQQLTEELMKSPHEFVYKLAGWRSNSG